MGKPILKRHSNSSGTKLTTDLSSIGTTGPELNS